MGRFRSIMDCFRSHIVRFHTNIGRISFWHRPLSGRCSSRKFRPYSNMLYGPYYLLWFFFLLLNLSELSSILKFKHQRAYEHSKFRTFLNQRTFEYSSIWILSISPIYCQRGPHPKNITTNFVAISFISFFALWLRYLSISQKTFDKYGFFLTFSAIWKISQPKSKKPKILVALMANIRTSNISILKKRKLSNI